MVSTPSHSQYLCPDFLSPMTSTADNGKSPLAMLAQTCQNIGAGSDSKHKDKNGHSPRNGKDGERRSGSSLSAQTDENGNKSALDKLHGRPGSASNPPGLVMPPNLPASLRASAACGMLPGVLPYHQAAAAAAAFGGYGMGGFGGYPFMPGFPGMNPSAGAPRMCVDPLCKGCPSSIPSVQGGHHGHGHQQSAHDMATQMLLAASPYGSLLAAQYPGLSMPSMMYGLGAPNPFLQTTAVLSNTTTSSPSTSHQPQSTPSSSHDSHICKWTQEDGSLCMRSFSTESELSGHVSTHAAAKPTHNSNGNGYGGSNGIITPKVEKLSPRERSPVDRKPIISSAATTSSGPGTPLSTPSSLGPMRNTNSPRTAAYLNALRFSPYGKLQGMNGFNGLNGLSGLPNGGPPVSLPFSPYAAAMSALYAQRLPGSLPHP